MATTVIIPARNEEATIGKIVRAFHEHPETAHNVYVALDADTIDQTAEEVWASGGCAIHTDQRGKGQVVNAGLRMVQQNAFLSDYIILCDGDYEGLTVNHIQRLINHAHGGMVIGVPDWPYMDVPNHVIYSWPRVSGFRYLQWQLIPHSAHGYLLETQLNLNAQKLQVPVYFREMPGLISPFRWPLAPKRMEELLRDEKWGKEHGIL